MTPEKVRDLYYEKYRLYMKENHHQWDKPIIQEELSLRAWADVIESIKSDCLREMAEKYLSNQT